MHINANGDNLPDGPSCFVAGWGSSMRALKSVDVNIFSSEYCNNMTQSYEGTYEPELEFCAGHMEGEKGSCDSVDRGGPLICNNDANEPVVYGITSSTDSCARFS